VRKFPSYYEYAIYICIRPSAFLLVLNCKRNRKVLTSVSNFVQFTYASFTFCLCLVRINTFCIYNCIIWSILDIHMNHWPWTMHNKWKKRLNKKPTPTKFIRVPSAPAEESRKRLKSEKKNNSPTRSPTPERTTPERKAALQAEDLRGSPYRTGKRSRSPSVLSDHSSPAQYTDEQIKGALKRCVDDYYNKHDNASHPARPEIEADRKIQADMAAIAHTNWLRQ